MTRAEQAIEGYYGNIPDDADKVKAARYFYKQAEKDLGWHSVEESLPEIDEEVIVLTDEIGAAPIYKISFGHIVNKARYKDYNGWNIPGVKFWMPCPEIPNND